MFTQITNDYFNPTTGDHDYNQIGGAVVFSGSDSSCGNPIQTICPFIKDKTRLNFRVCNKPFADSGKQEIQLMKKIAANLFISNKLNAAYTPAFAAANDCLVADATVACEAC
jgi:hypothetical protein